MNLENIKFLKPVKDCTESNEYAVVNIAYTMLSEYRVPSINNNENEAYYTDDLEDALLTASAMYKEESEKFNLFFNIANYND